MNIIVAADSNWGIGKNNQLLVSIPADMKMFRQNVLLLHIPDGEVQKDIRFSASYPGLLPDIRL